MLNTRQKIGIARIMARGILLARRCVGMGPIASVTRDGIRWQLDLREGIDLAVYLGVYERDTVIAFRRMVRPGSVVLDIGANIGAHTLQFAGLVGPDGKVIAFEPTDFAMHKLRANLALNPQLASRVDTHQVMLAERPDHPVAPEIYSSWPLFTVDDLHPRHRGRLMPSTLAEVTSLDALVAELGLGRIDLIKLDVDGHEYSVLRGAAETLERFKPLVLMELAAHVLRDFGRRVEDVVNILINGGYYFEDPSTRALLPTDPNGLARSCPEGGGRNIVAVPPGESPR